MTKSESTMRSRLVGILKSSYGLDAYPVENVVCPGMPDVVYCGEKWGWIECKKTKDWPKREATPVRLSHELMPSQKLWLRKHEKRGGNALVLVQISNDFVLLDAMSAVSYLGTAPKAELLAMALLHAEGWEHLEEELWEYL